MRTISRLSLPRIARGTPTLKELGFEGLEERSWFGLFAPAATPRPIIDKLNGEFNKALNNPETRQRLAAAGWEAAPGTPEQLRAMMKVDAAKWGRVIKAAGIKVN